MFSLVGVKWHTEVLSAGKDGAQNVTDAYQETAYPESTRYEKSDLQILSRLASE